MSKSYWSACSGTGLVLSLPEFEAMIERYKTLNPDQAQAVDEALENGNLEELRLVPSDAAGAKLKNFQDPDDPISKKLAFLMSEANSDYAEGAEIWPFYRPDGSMNVVDGEHPEKLCRDAMGIHNACYVCWSERSMCDARSFEKKPYMSYMEFKYEFTSRFGKYLPEDFDWDAHLGYISYAVYA